MSKPPKSPNIYHITHVDHLPKIIATGCLYSDAAMIARGGADVSIGMSDIKEYRLRKPVRCHPGTYVGDYTPFYFCSRSVMLYVISCRNNPGLAYTGGQESIVHLEANLRDAVTWAEENGRRWAFTDMNARTGWADFFADLENLEEINWTAMAAKHWSAGEIKEAKQAEFLMHEEFPWSLVSRIGVIDTEMKARVEAALEAADHRPPVEMRRNWYY